MTAHSFKFFVESFQSLIIIVIVWLYSKYSFIIPIVTSIMTCVLEEKADLERAG